ncbi:hypothetical protein FEM03_13255 [Phragmitibacter flavus]|uniref:Uncharacterized protein n=1 Tax=Phragmitibacter flavus TaxID=2576071 RepID=A0A5R8KCX3_9BACT|nr:hypothetical protein [Phragmitibacter flavus]TLD70156.1 hypothetical protein FEM03_13255 [Phragmitibacter flavus]
MKPLIRSIIGLSLAMFLVLCVFIQSSDAAPRHRPGNPRGIADPRGVLDPRGIADPRGVFDPRGPFDPRNPARYMYGLPAARATRVYAGVSYYYCSGSYYYPYIINGQSVYVLCTVRGGVPVIPPRPY